MSTPAIAPVIVSEAIQHILFTPPTPTTTYEKALDRLGLKRQATRAAVNRAIRKHLTVNQAPDFSDSWNAPMYTMMLRSDHYHAGERAKQQEVHYSIFGTLSKSQFTRFDIEFLSTSCCPDEFEIDREELRLIRETLTKVLGVGVLSKIGTWEHPVMKKLLGVRLKVMVIGRIPEATRDEISSVLRDLDVNVADRDVSIQNWHVFDKESFNDELKALVAPDLPKNDELRAEFEFLLQGIQQINVGGLSKEDRAKFAIDAQDYANCASASDESDEIPSVPLPEIVAPPGKIVLSHIPRSPKTGKLARYVSKPVPADTRIEDLGPDDWLEIIPPS